MFPKYQREIVHGKNEVAVHFRVNPKTEQHGPYAYQIKYSNEYSLDCAVTASKFVVSI